MEDYPKSISELETRFSSEQECRDYLVKLRWPEGFVCPRCEGQKFWETKRGYLVCSKCQYQMTVLSGTIFQDTRKPLVLWFRAIWYVTSQKTGTSALGLQRVLGLGSYQTAWAWLHKLRRAMIRPGRDGLRGRVEVDETYIGAPEEGLLGRKRDKKTLIAIAAEENGKKVGRIRMKRIPNVSRRVLHGFIRESVEPGSTIHTDGWQAYRALDQYGYRHEVSDIMKSDKSAVELMPRVHIVSSLLKRWLMGTHQGAVSPEHLDYYLDEFTFRFNRRTSRSRGKLFYRLVQHAVAVEPIPYRELIKHSRGRKSHDHKI